MENPVETEDGEPLDADQRREIIDEYAEKLNRLNWKQRRELRETAHEAGEPGRVFFESLNKDEQVYLIEPYADDEGHTRTVLANAQGDLAATMSWSVEELPYLTQWKNSVAEGDGYVMCVIYDASTELSELMILDANTMCDEIACVPLKNHVPHGFHCGYTPL